MRILTGMNASCGPLTSCHDDHTVARPDTGVGSWRELGGAPRDRELAGATRDVRSPAELPLPQSGVVGHCSAGIDRRNGPLRRRCRPTRQPGSFRRAGGEDPRRAARVSGLLPRRPDGIDRSGGRCKRGTWAAGCHPGVAPWCGRPDPYRLPECHLPLAGCPTADGHPDQVGRGPAVAGHHRGAHRSDPGRHIDGLYRCRPVRDRFAHRRPRDRPTIAQGRREGDRGCHAAGGGGT